MYEQTKEILERNLQINLNQLEEQKAKVKYLVFLFIKNHQKKISFQEVEICFEKYSNKFTQLELELKHQMHNDEYDISHDNSSSSRSSRSTRASMPTMPHYPSEITTLSPQPRRQTMNQ